MSSRSASSDAGVGSRSCCWVSADELETIQVARRDFLEFGRIAAQNAFGYVGGCCGCNAAYIRALAAGIAA